MTKHGKVRLKQRFSKINHSNIIRNVKKRGFTVTDARGELKQYMNKRNRSTQALAYKEQIFLFSRKNKKLITTFPIPENLLEDYEETMKALKGKWLFTAKEIEEESQMMFIAFEQKKDAVEYFLSNEGGSLPEELRLLKCKVSNYQKSSDLFLFDRKDVVKKKEVKVKRS